MSEFKKLSRTEMRNVTGGDLPAQCVVKCYNVYGNAPYGTYYGFMDEPNCDFDYTSSCKYHYGWEESNYATCTCSGPPA